MYVLKVRHLKFIGLKRLFYFQRQNNKYSITNSICQQMKSQLFSSSEPVKQETEKTFDTDDTQFQYSESQGYRHRFQAHQLKDKLKKRFTRTKNTTMGQEKIDKNQERRMSLTRKNETRSTRSFKVECEKGSKFQQTSKPKELFQIVRSPVQAKYSGRHSLSGRLQKTSNRSHRQIRTGLLQREKEPFLQVIKQRSLSRQSVSVDKCRNSKKKENKNDDKDNIIFQRENKENETRSSKSKSVDKIKRKQSIAKDDSRILQFQMQVAQKQNEALKILNQKLAKKNEQYQQEISKAEKELIGNRKQIKILSEKNKTLEEQVVKLSKEKDEDQQLVKKLEGQIKEVNKQRQIAMKQLKIFFERKVPKNIRELQSFREAYLEKEVDELKIVLKKGKDTRVQEMEEEIERLRSELLQQNQYISNLDLQNRMLAHKMEQDKKYITKFTIFRNQNKNLKFTLKQIKHECDILKKENEILRNEFRNLIQNMKLSKIGRNSRAFSRASSETQSLALSVSVESR